jgi:hypothetical protein
LGGRRDAAITDDGKVKMEVLLVAALNKEVELWGMCAAHLDMNLLELKRFLSCVLSSARPGVWSSISVRHESVAETAS